MQSILIKVKFKIFFQQSTDINYYTFINAVIEGASYDSAKKVAKYIEDLFKGEKMKLRELLSYQNRDGETVFAQVENDNNHNLKLFIDLLRSTFEENENDTFNDYFIKISRKKPRRKTKLQLLGNFINNNIKIKDLEDRDT